MIFIITFKVYCFYEEPKLLGTLQIFFLMSMTAMTRPFGTDLFGYTGDRTENKFVPTIPRVQEHRRSDPHAVAAQHMTVEDLLPVVGGQTKYSNRKSGFPTDEGAKVATSVSVEGQRSKHWRGDGTDSPKQHKGRIILFAEEYTHLKRVLNVCTIKVENKPEMSRMILVRKFFFCFCFLLCFVLLIV